MPWTAEAAEQAVRGYAERKGAKLGAVAQPLRAALTGRTTSPGIFNVLAVLGRDGKPGAAARSVGLAAGSTCPPLQRTTEWDTQFNWASARSPHARRMSF